MKYLVIFLSLLFLSGCFSTTWTVYLRDGDKIYVEGESGLIVSMYEGCVEVQSGHAVLKSGEKAVVGTPAEEEYIDQWNRWGLNE